MKTTHPSSPISAQKLTSLHQILACAALLALPLAFSGTAQAATLTWTGTTDGDWNDASNWGGSGPPASGDNLIFTGTSNTATSNDIPSPNIAGIQFTNTTNGASFSLGGDGIILNGNITTAAVVGDGSITDTISMELRPTSTFRTFDLGADHNVHVTGRIHGPQGIHKQGDGTLTLSGANDYYNTAATTVGGGTLRVQSRTALGTTAGATTVANGATLELNYTPPNNSSPIEENITLNGAGVGGTEGALKITGTGPGNELGNNTITLGSNATINTLARFDTNSTITDNGNGYTLTKTGSNYSHFMNAGGVTANFTHLVIAEGDYWAGPLSLPSGVGTSVTVANGAQLTTWGSQTIANSPDITFEGGSTFRTDRANDTMSINGTMTLNGNVTFSGPQATHTANIDSTIGGAGTLFKTGPNTTILSGANTHNKTQIGETNGSNAGTLSILHNTALGSGSLDYGAGGTLDLGVSGLTVGNNVFIGNRTDNSDYKIRLDLAGSATGELTNNIEIRKSTAKAFVAEVGDGDTLTFSGSTTTGAGGGAGITKTGAGTLRLTNANNSFSGKFYVDGGELQIAESGRISDQTIEIASGATFRWSSSAQADGGDTYFTGGIRGDGTFIKDGSNNTFTTRFGTYDIANIQILQGTMQGVGNINALGQGTTTVYLGDTTGSNNATMNYGGALSGAMTTKANIIVQAGSSGTKTFAKGNTSDMTDNTTITLNDDLSVSANSAGTLTLGGVISGSGGLTKTNTGTLELSGDNTYTGTTSVSAGTLALSSTDNNIANSTVIDVASGATFDVSGVTNGFALANGQTIYGTGSVVGGTTVGAGATLSPGNSPGSQTFEDLTWVNSGTYLWEINADLASGGGKGVDSGWDWIDVTNTFDLSGITTGFNIDITSLTNPGNIAGLADGFNYTGKTYLDSFESFTILSFGSLTGDFDASEFNLLTGNFANSKVGWNIDIVGNDLVLNAVFVPEPSSTALLGLGGLALMLRRKRS